MRCKKKILFSVLILVLFTSIGYAEDNEEIVNHEMFEFEAGIKESNIKDGTEPFDSDNEAGNDSTYNNGIVRSFDTVTYPVKITINPKKADVLKNIKLRISGTLDNGIVGKRVNAKFSVDGYTDMDKKIVGFNQEYIVERTGNSIMIPVAVEVKGAEPDVVLKPKIRVGVVSVDGEEIKGVKTEFNDLPGVRVSAKVNIKPYVSAGLSGNGIPFYPYSGITDDDEDKENIHSFSISFGAEKLAGKSDLRGATFPDPEGKINFKIKMNGYVAWDAKPHKTGVEHFDFDGRDKSFELFDHQPINHNVNKIGNKHMLSDGEPYRFVYRHNYIAPMSQFSNYNENTIKKESHHRVWESGDWNVDKPEVTDSDVLYEGYNTGYTIGTTFPIHRSDGYTEHAYYGADAKIFSSHSFLVFMNNEYRIGGENNPNDYANNAYYRAYVYLTDYTDKDGNVTEINKSGSTSFSERNNPAGSYSLQNTLYAHPSGRQIGTPNIGWSAVCKGDASVLIGENVRQYGSYYTRSISYGGVTGVYRWNPDSFELTKENAEYARRNMQSRGYYKPSLKIIRNDKDTIHTYYGIPKFSDEDFEFDRFTQKGKDDYDWYEDFDEASEKGTVSAFMSDITAPIGAKWGGLAYMPLKVRYDNIDLGSKNKNGTDSIVVFNLYGYPQADRKREVDVTGNKSYYNPAIWDENGVMIKKQVPSGGTVNFETLAVAPAEMSSSIKTDKEAYYNSETIDWTVKNSIVLPESGVPDEIDSSVKITQTLPKGLNYKAGSGKIGKRESEPEVFKKSNGETELVWDLLVSGIDKSLDDVSFQTTINPFALSANGVSSSVTVKSVIDSDLDKRPIHLRRTDKTVTILKVGMVGIYESIDELHGDKNSDYTVTLSPYTTIEDESNVKALTHIPLSNDKLGSKYSGSATLKSIDMKVDRKHDYPVKIYLNNKYADIKKPNDIDIKKGGWYEYKKGADLSNVVSILFHVENLMTSSDDIEMKLNIATKNNNFGDVYLNETVINSDTDYRLSPVSNRVRYMIRADLELKLERFRIYTNKEGEGLPSSIWLHQVVLDENSVKDLPIKLVIYDKDKSKKLKEISFKQKDLKRQNDVIIPNDGLAKGSSKNYIVKIEGFDENKVWVRDGEGELDTQGFISTEKVFTEGDETDSGISFKGVTATEKSLGKDMVKYYETIDIDRIKDKFVKSGYGFNLKPKVKYKNNLRNQVESRLNTKFDTDITLNVDTNLMDKSIEYYNETKNDVNIKMHREEEVKDGTFVSDYDLPKVYLDNDTGLTYTRRQVDDNNLENVVDGGNKLYVPIWIDNLGNHDVNLKSNNALGSNFIMFDLDKKINVDSYMFSHTDSNTTDKDELLLKPLSRSDELNFE